MVSSGISSSLEDAKKLLLSKLENGEALEKFQQMLECSGVTKQVASKLCSRDPDCYSVLPESKFKFDIKAQSTGDDLTFSPVNFVYAQLGFCRFHSRNRRDTGGPRLQLPGGGQEAE